MPAPLIPKAEVVNRVMTVFSQCGLEGATLSRIAEATGLGKASLYHYFPGGKEEMVNVALDIIEAWIRENVTATLNETLPPKQRLALIMRKVDALYDGGRSACLLGALVASDSSDLFRKRVRAIFDEWIGALARAMVDAGVDRKVARERAEDAVARIEGALILARGRGDTAPFRRLMRRLPDELVSG